MKQSLLTILLLFLPMLANAEVVEIDGFYYQNFVSKLKTVEVTSNPNKYSGTIVIPKTVSYNGISYNVTTIGEKAFYDCIGLTSVTIPNSVISIGNYTFQNCTSLTSIKIPNSVNSIGYYAFGGCSSLSSVFIDDGKEALTVSRGVYSNTTIFSNCPIESLYLGRTINYSSDIYANYSPFEGITKLQTLTISNSVTNIQEGLFKGCSGLTSVTIPNSVISLGGRAFEDCSGLTIISIPNSVTNIGGSAFSGCSKLASITIPSSVTSINGFTFQDCSNLASITIPNSVTSIYAHAFENCSSLTSVTIPNSVTSIGESAFSNCTSLTDITIPNSVTTIGSSAFANCIGLTRIIIGNSVKRIDGSAFWKCSGLKNITIGKSVESIGEYCFIYCSSLTSVTIPSSLKSIGNLAFSGCNNLYEVHISDIGTWSRIKNKHSASNPFFYADHLYLNDVEITDLVIPNSVTEMESFAFSGIGGLKSVIIPNSVTDIVNGAFDGCSGLRTVYIGSDVKDVGNASFSNCPELTDFYCFAENVPNTQTDAFNGSYIDLATLHVPSSAVESYKATAPWSSFKNIVATDGSLPPTPPVPPTPETPKCSTPTITYENGELTFSCATEGVEYMSEVTVTDAKKYYTDKVMLSTTYKVSVYAMKTGYDNSDVATTEINVGGSGGGPIGDLSGDGKVNAVDLTKMIEILLKRSN